MKIPSLIWVALAGGILSWIALRSPGGDYQPLDLDEMPEEVPVLLSADPGPGDLVRVFDVEGMCCNGCASKLVGRLGELGAVSETAVDVQGATVSVIVEESCPVEDLLTVLNTEKYRASARP